MENCPYGNGNVHNLPPWTSISNQAVRWSVRNEFFFITGKLKKMAGKLPEKIFNVWK